MSPEALKLRLAAIARVQGTIARIEALDDRSAGDALDGAFADLEAEFEITKRFVRDPQFPALDAEFRVTGQGLTGISTKGSIGALKAWLRKAEVMEE